MMRKRAVGSIICYQYNVEYRLAYTDPTTLVSAMSVTHDKQEFFCEPSYKFNGETVRFNTKYSEQVWTPVAVWKIKRK
jgi:hypothetical protein